VPSGCTCKFSYAGTISPAIGGSGYNGNCSYVSFTCFPAAAETFVYGRGFVPVGQLRYGDLVEDGSTQGGSPFIADLHTETGLHVFVEIAALSGSVVLRLTDSHILYVVDPATGTPRGVRADDVVIGDVVLHVSRNGSTQEVAVESVTLAADMGLHSPLTQSGRIVVDGILASCFADSLGLRDLSDVDSVYLLYQPLVWLYHAFPGLARLRGPSVLHWYEFVAFYPYSLYVLAKQALFAPSTLPEAWSAILQLRSFMHSWVGTPHSEARRPSTTAACGEVAT